MHLHRSRRPTFAPRTGEKWRYLLLALAPIAVGLPPTALAEFSGVVTLTSEYVYHGQALSGGNPALQLGLDYEHDSGIFAGVWAGTVDLPNPTGRRDVELDYYAGYHYEPDGPLSLSASLMRYTYPGQSGFIDYDYTQAVITAALHQRYSIEFGYSPEVYGFESIGRYWELRSDWPLRSGWVIGTGLGLNDIRDLGASRYLYWDVGASARFSRLIVDLRWYDNESPGGFFQRLSADSRFVVSLSLPF